jgi:hypothetical protein
MNARAFLLAGIAMLGLFVQQAVAITGGELDEKNAYSNVGACVYRAATSGPDIGKPFVLFSGTLIHPRVFLTAGHCTDLYRQYSDLIPLTCVSFGTDALDPSTWRDIEAVITHPQYRPIGTNNPAYNDVGVIILKKPINTRKIPLAKLPYEGFLDDLQAAGLLREPGQGGTPFTVAGYGATLDWPPPTEVAPDGLRRFAQTEYLALTESWLFTQQNPATGNGGTGLHDSGGPTFWVDGDGTLVLVAVISRGNWKDMSTNIAWRVDLPGTLDFIDWVIDDVLPTLP